MQGYYAIQVAELLNIHRETISEYVKKFNNGGMEELLRAGMHQDGFRISPMRRNSEWCRAYLGLAEKECHCESVPCYTKRYSRLCHFFLRTRGGISRESSTLTGFYGHVGKIKWTYINVRLAIEMGSSLGWREYIGDKGKVIAIDHFGASAPVSKLLEEYGFTVGNVVKNFKEILESVKG